MLMTLQKSNESHNLVPVKSVHLKKKWVLRAREYLKQRAISSIRSTPFLFCRLFVITDSRGHKSSYISGKPGVDGYCGIFPF